MKQIRGLLILATVLWFNGAVAQTMEDLQKRLEKPITQAELRPVYPRMQSLFESGAGPGSTPDEAFVAAGGGPADQEVLMPFLIYALQSEEKIFMSRPADEKKVDAWRDKIYFDAAQDMRALKREMERANRVSGEQIGKVMLFAMRLRAASGRFVTNSQFASEDLLRQMKEVAHAKAQVYARANPAVSDRVAPKPEAAAGEDATDPAPQPETGAAQAD